MIMERYVNLIGHNNFVRIVLIWIALDTVLGCLRAVKEKKFNSTVGIDGAIRKVAMVVCVAVLMMVDILINLNIFVWLPKNVGATLETWGMGKLGIGEFFCILFILYESVSILKNMMLCGLPVPKWLKDRIQKFLDGMTAELQGKNIKDV